MQYCRGWRRRKFFKLNTYVRKVCGYIDNPFLHPYAVLQRGWRRKLFL
jgi:hypothetical protein